MRKENTRRVNRDSCCKDCMNRSTFCRTSCADYLEERAEWKAIREERAKEAAVESYWYDLRDKRTSHYLRTAHHPGKLYTGQHRG